jgi:hypothetical protein
MVKIKINFFFFLPDCHVASSFSILGPTYCVDGMGIVIFGLLHRVCLRRLWKFDHILIINILSLA